jgi:hypothetical protein
MQKQSKITHYALIMALLCLHVTLNAQELQNPSFEGVGGVARIPQGWQAFGLASSPDTQPGAWGVTTTASHGNSYISMVCRGFSIFDSYLWESCTQKLNSPLIVGKTYHYSIDLATSKTFVADTILFDKPAQLRLWGMSANSEKELLWESGAVSNSDWKTFYFGVTPSIATNFFILEAYYVELPKYCGNILIDNMKYYPEKPLVVDNHHSGLDPESPKITSADTIPTKIDGRTINKKTDFIFKGEKLTITIWDNRTADGDVVSLFLNNKNILEEFTLTKSRLDVEVQVEEDKDYYLTLYAHNLGDIPPNTVALYITDGLRKKFITLSSNLDKCEAVKLKIKPEEEKAELVH